MELFDFPEEKWREAESVVFTFQPGMQGGDESEWMDIVVRHRDNFPYADLLLEVKGIRPDKKFWIDTVAVRLAEKSAGKNGQYYWVGRPYSNHYEITRRYRERIQYRSHEADSTSVPTDSGREYAVSIRQISGEDLQGILSIGIVTGGGHGIDPCK